MAQDNHVMTFNTNGGPVELHRAEPGERCSESIDHVLQIARLCLERGYAVPRAFTLAAKDYDYLTSMLLATKGHIE